jgi:16S rRNA G527 N7-methylase RsmG
MFVNVSEVTNMIDKDMLMETFDRWDSHERRERFLRRMEHKLNAKERRVVSGRS